MINIVNVVLQAWGLLPMERFEPHLAETDRLEASCRELIAPLTFQICRLPHLHNEAHHIFPFLPVTVNGFNRTLAKKLLPRC